MVVEDITMVFVGYQEDGEEAKKKKEDVSNYVSLLGLPLRRITVSVALATEIDCLIVLDARNPKSRCQQVGVF